MIKPIVVDDERIALESLAKKLERIDGCLLYTSRCV